MNSTIAPRLKNASGLLFGCLCAGLLSVFPAIAQTTKSAAQDSSSAGLGKRIHLSLGVTTVEKVMSALSEQTGLNIKAADYLNERKLIVHIENSTAAEALDSLDEINDWIWYKTLPGQVLITRRKLRLDPSAAAVPRMMQAAIPKDIRTYLSIPTPTEDLATRENKLDFNLNAGVHPMNQRLFKSLLLDQSELLTSLQPDILSGNAVPYSKLTSRQRILLLESLVFPVFNRTRLLLHGDVLPHVENVNNAVLQLSDTTMKVGSLINDGTSDQVFGFAASIIP